MKYLRGLIPWWMIVACSGPVAPDPPENSKITASGNPTQAQASYLGESACTGCHTVENSHWSHTVHARVFRGNPRNPLEAKSCEACHGPGSEHLKVPADKSKIMAFIRASGSSIAQQNAMCWQCHRGGERIHWPGSIHEINDLACSDCHNPMANFSRNGLLRKAGISQTCFGCHQQQRSDFHKRSHMPLPEGSNSRPPCNRLIFKQLNFSFRNVLTPLFSHS